ncbi:hypothetical protein MRX96_042258 [Rhipicephalus microplus]
MGGREPLAVSGLFFLGGRARTDETARTAGLLAAAASVCFPNAALPAAAARAKWVHPACVGSAPHGVRAQPRVNPGKDPGLSPLYFILRSKTERERVGTIF